MRKTILLALLGVGALCAPAHAQFTFDMAKVTCADYSAMDPAAARDFSAWMSGWFNQRRGKTSVNLEGYRKNVASVQSWCASNPRASIMAALETSAANAKPGQGGPTELNVAQVTCGEFLKSPSDDQALLASWLGGWFMSTKNLTNVDVRYVQRNSQKVGDYCKKMKKASLISAVEKNWR